MDEVRVKCATRLDALFRSILLCHLTNPVSVLGTVTELHCIVSAKLPQPHRLELPLLTLCSRQLHTDKSRFRIPEFMDLCAVYSSFQDQQNDEPPNQRGW